MSENLITWNVGGKPDRVLLAALSELAEKHRPVAFALQEVADRASLLADFCDQHGYQLVRVDKGSHSTSVVLLVRPDIPVKSSSALALSVRTWVGRQVAGSRDDGMTAPKWLTYTRVRFLGVNWIVGSTHLTPSHHVSLARVLVRVQVGLIAVWMRTRLRVVLVGGDFNETLGYKHNLLAPLKAVATPYTATSHGNRAIDMWWVAQRRLSSRGIGVDVRALSDVDASDHKPVMLTLTRRLDARR